MCCVKSFKLLTDCVRSTWGWRRFLDCGGRGLVLIEKMNSNALVCGRDILWHFKSWCIISIDSSVEWVWKSSFHIPNRKEFVTVYTMLKHKINKSAHTKTVVQSFSLCTILFFPFPLRLSVSFTRSWQVKMLASKSKFLLLRLVALMLYTRYWCRQNCFVWTRVA